jgi:solute carrier family 25 phosphate transporter 23/24/25/41
MFIIATEQELRRLFDKIDTSRNGKLEYEEVQHALEISGIQIHPSILRAFFDSVDSNHDGVIEFNEWRDFLLLVPLDKASIKNVFHYYQEHAHVTTSEGDAYVSYDTLQGFGYFIAGGTAGAVSRTATAPFDRLKTYLIANTGSKVSAAGAVNASLKAVGDGQLAKAVHKAGSPLVEAVKAVYRLGGLRSFFVGQSYYSKLIVGNGLNVLKVFPESAIRFGYTVSLSA